MPLTKRPNVHEDYKRIHKRGDAAVKVALKAVEKRHKKLVEPWKRSEDKPDFGHFTQVQPGRIVGVVVMQAQKAEQATLSVWQLLNKGTRIRYMMLSQEGHPAGKWISKTSAGSITSGPGGGVRMGLDLEDPEGGIHKREFDKNVAEAVEAMVDGLVNGAYEQGF